MPNCFLDARAAPYNCDPTGAADSLAGARRALADLAAAGGGALVFVGEGSPGYALSGPLQIPSNVHLLGVAGATLTPFGGYAGPIATVGLPGTAGQFDASFRPPSDSAYDFTPQAGVHYYALANKGLAALCVTGHPLQFGYLSPQHRPDYWAGVGTLCVDLYVERPVGATWPNGTKLCGTWDSFNQPQPWSIEVTTDGFWLNLKGDEPAYRVAGGWHRLHAACDLTPARFRLIFQVDTATGTAEAWVNSSHVTMTGVANFPAAGQESIAGLSLLESNGLRPFMVGYGNDEMDGRPGGFTDLTVYGLMVCRGRKYQWGVATPTLTTTPAIPVDDNVRYFTAGPQTVPADSYVANLPLTDPGGTDPWCDLSSSFGRGLLFWCPPVDDTNSPDGVAIEGLELQSPVQPAMLFGQHLTVRVRRVKAVSGGQGWGSLPLRGSYYCYVDDCQLSGWDAGFASYSQIGEIRKLVVDGAGRQALRFGLGQWLIDGVKVGGSNPWTETILTITGGGDGAGYEVRNVFVDDETNGISIGRAAVLIDSGQGDIGSYRLTEFKVAAAPTFVELDGAGLARCTASRVDVAGLYSFDLCPAALHVVGPQQFFGTFDASTLKGAVKAVDVSGADAAITYTPPNPLL